MNVQVMKIMVVIFPFLYSYSFGEPVRGKLMVSLAIVSRVGVVVREAYADMIIEPDVSVTERPVYVLFFVNL